MSSELKDIFDSLAISVEAEKIGILTLISKKLAIAGNDKEHVSFTRSLLENSTVVAALASTMAHNEKWARDFPQHFKLLICIIYYRMKCNIPFEQTEALVNACITYLAIYVNIDTIMALRYVATPVTNRAPLARDFLYEAIKNALFGNNNKDIETTTVRFLQDVSENCLEWQARILHDPKTIQKLLSILPNNDVWIVFANVCHHPDAKVWLPREVLEKASENKNFDACTDILAILCTESFPTFHLETSYVRERATNLANMLDHQTNLVTNDVYTLLDLVLPLVNLSIADNNKDILGEYFIPLLLRVLEIKESTDLIHEISDCLERSQQEAAMTLWHLAFSEKNCQRIQEANGMQVLNQKHSPPLLQKIVNGVKYMFSSDYNPQKSVPARARIVRKHVMISYCSNQPIVLKLANTLRESGYSIWLDTDQLGGNTFEVLAEAIERASLVLMCVSQKYKDSPNCRLEFKYCQMQHVDMIPLIVQKDYHPDGWVDIKSSKTFDFSDDSDWYNKSLSLQKVIGARGKASRSSINLKLSSEIEVSPEQIELKDKIGEGGYGDVWKAKWNGKGGGIIVAVKKIPLPINSPIIQDELTAEVVILAKLRHPNIIPIYAFSFTDKELLLVMEFIDAGNLFDILHNEDIVLDWDVRLRIALEALRGVHVLHTTVPKILHRDIKSLNFLVSNDNKTVKLIDFGMSKVHLVATVADGMAGQSSELESGRESVGTIRWGAPETFDIPPKWTTKADIYSLGITFYEIASRKVPFEEISDNQRVIYQVCTNRYRPSLPEDCPAEFAEIIYSCWDHDMDYRPSSLELLVKLEQLTVSTTYS